MLKKKILLFIANSFNDSSIEKSVCSSVISHAYNLLYKINEDHGQHIYIYMFPLKFS